jgi:hypothetical protein
MSTSQKNKVQHLTAIVGPVGGAHPLPAVGAPQPPVGWQPVQPVAVHKLAAPMRVQIDAAPAAAQELRTSSAYTTFLGTKVPEPRGLADALDFAVQWSHEVDAAEKWLEFAKNQATLAWTFTSSQLEALKAPIDLEESRDPAFRTALTSLKALVNARQANARRAAQNRVARERTAKKAAPVVATPPTAPVTLPPVPVVSPSPVAEAARVTPSA